MPAIKDYLNQLLKIITTNGYIESKTIFFDERPPNAAFINGTLKFINGSKLDLKEFILSDNENISFLKYGYNYSSIENILIFRYDNALDPKAKDLPTYPSHKHLPDILIPAHKPSLEPVLSEISSLIEINKHKIE